MKEIRQGDILIVPTKSEENQNGIYFDKYVVEEGEHHVHLLTAVLLLSSGVFQTTEESRLLHLTKDGKLAEHEPISLPSNLTFIVKKQVGYNYFASSEANKIQRIKD